MKTTADSGRAELRAALKTARRHFAYAGAFSCAVNALHLVPILYMLAVYDRVLTSGSVPTLATLTVIMVCLMAAMGGFEWTRSYILVMAGNKLDTVLRERVIDVSFKRALVHPADRNNAAPVNDLLGLRQFLSGHGVFGFFDAPWAPFYIAVMFVFHPLFGVLAVFCAVVMLCLALAAESATGKTLKRANDQTNRDNSRLVSGLRNAEVIYAMGMANAARRQLQAGGGQVLRLQTEASKRAGALSAASKSFRLMMQSCALGVGAWLAIMQEISPGMAIAGSLLLGRALAPIDLLVASWKNFAVARGQYGRLKTFLSQIPRGEERMKLPAPQGKLEVEHITVAPPETQTPVLRDIHFTVNPGETLGVIGPSAAGKSSLARAVLGLWPTQKGVVRLDGADIDGWGREDLGEYVGYLPQSTELFGDTVGANIRRLGEHDADKIVAAARLAGAHEMILRLPQGYDTVIAADGGVLSGGQLQRVGLARAVYGGPRLLVLDEPNANLDDNGEWELLAALKRVKAAGCATIIVSHRKRVLAAADKILLLRDGRMADYGPRDAVLKKLAVATNKRPT